MRVKQVESGLESGVTRASIVPSKDELAAPPPQSQRGAGMPDSDGKIC